MFNANGKQHVVDYYCARNRIVLLRDGLERGRVWYANAARWGGVSHGYTLLGERPVRRVYFGVLPPPLARQNKLAHTAVRAAEGFIRRKGRNKPHFDLAWVRLSLPGAYWAYVMFTNVDGKQSWFALLHLADGKWRDASAYKPYCTRLPTQVRKQLFLDRGVRFFVPIAPNGEQRC